jgi:diguanylate cyclase (GGDEF)-like protein
MPTVESHFALFEETIERAATDRRHDKLTVAGAMDQLTGVLNHSMILAHLQEALSLHKVYPVPFCALCISIDGAAKIRERFGQAAVDATLNVVAQTLQSALRPTDFLGRWREQEFLAVLTECNESDVARVGERLRKMAQRAQVSWWGDTWGATISMGGTQVQDMDTSGGIVGRRVSLIVQYLEKKPAPEAEGREKAEGEAGVGGEEKGGKEAGTVEGVHGAEAGEKKRE